VAGALLALTLSATAQAAYTFGEPGVRATGPELRFYDWSAQKCNTDDIPDQPARAFRDAAGNVTLIDTHHVVRRWVGPTLATVAHVCTTIMSSGLNADPSKYDDREWLSSVWTPDGNTVYGLIHAEYQGWDFSPGYCVRSGETFSDKQKCWYNAITLTSSTNGGASFSHTTPPTHYVAGPPQPYSVGSGPIGFFQPSNIVRGKDGFFYAMVHAEQGTGPQPTGACLLRTNDLADPGSWRAWGGAGFTVQFHDPYLSGSTAGICTPVSKPHIGTLSESLTWSTYFRKWVLAGAADNADGVSGPGFYYYTSDDLVNWSPAKLLMKGELPWTYRCQDGPEQLRDPSLLDNDSKSRNFDTIGQRPFLYFTRFNVQFNSPTSCFTSLDRDLIRIPVEFSNRQPGGPVAALAASTQAPQTGAQVRFDASGSSDPDGSIAAFKWDLDGDGTFERDTGTNPVTTRFYAAPDKVTVTVRVCDNSGKATDQTTLLDVSGPAVTAPPAEGPAAAACPQTSGGNGGGSGGGGAGGGSGGVGTGGGSAGGGGTTAPPPPAASTTQQSAPAIELFRLAGKPRVRRDGSVVLRVLVPAAGRFMVRGAGTRSAIRPASASASKAGSLSVTVRPSKTGLALLRRKGRARVKTTLVFTPIGGKPQRATRVLTLRRSAR
jgi:uncharacterized membrane protein YgcG